MAVNSNELARRKEAALNAIVSVYGTPADEYGATLFVSHHLEQIEPDYWMERLGTAMPNSSQVLALLEYRPKSCGDDLNSLDFTLPGDVTNYVICATLEANGSVRDIAMES